MTETLRQDRGRKRGFHMREEDMERFSRIEIEQRSQRESLDEYQRRNRNRSRLSGLTGGRTDSRSSGRGSGRRSRRGRSAASGAAASVLAFGLAVIIAFLAGVGAGWYRWGRMGGYRVNLASIQAPDWVEQDFIRKNIYSRPAASMREVKDIVIHYVANPGSTARQNRNYFDGLADQKGENAVSASAHFIIGLDGEIIQCIPINEIAYASNNRNSDSIAIECCHPDETGQFTEETYASLVKLTAWLCDETKISRRNIIRHYDITGKACPKYFVDHEDAWKAFKKEVREFSE
ncbi:MAG: peptidoglycan recognition family protein [Lachnospiraceae bacterium]|nr:peptidoglycan recognition family protein [Lachnospiraceae bacterium]